jgi:hypothetical protein
MIYVLWEYPRMNRSAKAYFQLILKEKDWVHQYRCWNCQLLGVPSVKVIRVTGDAGQEFSPSAYRVLPGSIFWTGDLNSHPGEITLSIQMSTQELAFKSGQDKWKLSTFISSGIAVIMTTVALPLVLEYCKRGLWPAPPSQTTQVTPSPKQSGASSPQVSIPKPSKNPYDDLTQYPTMDGKPCGKLHISKTTYPEKNYEYYPIFIPGKYSIDEAKRFCHDAYIKPGSPDIQIASFTDESQANLFVGFIQKHFPGARRGKPS